MLGQVARHHPPRMNAEALRCPDCRSIDWIRDGYAMGERRDGIIDRVRFGPSVNIAAKWACAGCDREVDADTTLDRIIREAAIAHVE
jgi:DNA-directed RNA polymerase subunit RPC12/RpoP